MGHVPAQHSTAQQQSAPYSTHRQSGSAINLGLGIFSPDYRPQPAPLGPSSSSALPPTVVDYGRQSNSIQGPPTLVYGSRQPSSQPPPQQQVPLLHVCGNRCCMHGHQFPCSMKLYFTCSKTFLLTQIMLARSSHRL